MAETRDFDLLYPHKSFEHVFKTVGSASIDLAVFYTEQPSDITPVPVVLFWHGGYLVSHD
jgi:hypothetical protein